VAKAVTAFNASASGLTVDIIVMAMALA